ncbi:hypothetical protein ABZ422_09350 [Micromonospora zamorensis]|uniref:hypothetical protein n=1 Tax=Micromonospora zamorensis TaxID=709883 RepID=UPI0033EC52F0
MIGRKEHQQEPLPVACGCRIALSDVARALADTGVVAVFFPVKRVELTAAEMGLDTAPDWAGRPSVMAGDAAALRAELVRRREAARTAQTEAARSREDVVRAGRDKLRVGVTLNGHPATPGA